nr:MAG TPA: hypothetical protein [Caudoviricetes sp.]
MIFVVGHPLSQESSLLSFSLLIHYNTKIVSCKWEKLLFSEKPH